jgi:hypothetical protein
MNVREDLIDFTDWDYKAICKPSAGWRSAARFLRRPLPDTTMACRTHRSWSNFPSSLKSCSV